MFCCVSHSYVSNFLALVVGKGIAEYTSCHNDTHLTSAAI